MEKRMGRSLIYNGTITAEQFLFYEIRIASKYYLDGTSVEDAIEEIKKNNLFQYPTERLVARMVRSCYKRLDALDDEQLRQELSSAPPEIAKQINLYLLSNEKAMSQIRTSTFWKTTFTRDCINHDREAICSGAFLTKATAFDAAEKIGKALHEFVVALFDSGKPEVIAEKRDEFTKNSAEINNLIDALRKELEI